MNISWIDLTILFVYLGAMACMGLYFAKRNSNTEQYFLGGRSFNGIVIGLSLVGTSISSITFLAFPADAFKTSWMRFLTAFMMPVAVFVASRFFLPFFRKSNVTSAYEYLEGRFGSSVRLYAASVFIIAQLVRVAIILYLLSLLVYEVTGLNPVLCVIITGIFVSFYTITGGIDAVIWTDVLQTIVLVAGGILCLAVIVSKVPGGMGEIINTALNHDKLSFSEYIDGNPVAIPWGLSLQKKTISMMFILGITSWMTVYCSDQNVVQRYCASKSIKEARKAMWVSVYSSIPIWAFYMFLGTALYVFFYHFPTPETTEMLEGARKSEQVLPFFIINYLPPGILGIVIAAAMSAAMSSLDSNINAVSTVFIVDIYKRYLAKDKLDKHYLFIARLIAVVVTVIMISGAVILLNTETKTLQDTANILVSVLTGGMLGIYLIGFFSRAGDWRAVWCGIVCTAVFTLWTVFSGRNLLPQGWNTTFDLYYTGLIGNIVMFVVGFAVALLLPRHRRNLTNLTVWDMEK
ncbi:MAG: sodium:solute symporter [Sedimentisphaeraceae bacterium JB056]